MTDLSSRSPEETTWTATSNNRAIQLEQRYGVTPLTVRESFVDEDLGEVVYNTLTYEPTGGEGALLLAVDLELDWDDKVDAVTVAKETLPPRDEVRERVADHSDSYQCPHCETYLSPWRDCVLCDFDSLDWWTGQLDESPSDHHRIAHAERALDSATASLATLRDRVPNLDASDDWDEDAIQMVNSRLDSLQRAVADINSEVSSAHLAVRDIDTDAQPDGSAPARRRVSCPDCGRSGSVHAGDGETWMECDDGHTWGHEPRHDSVSTARELGADIRPWRPAKKRPVEVEYAGPFTDPTVVETLEGQFEVDEAYIDEHGGFVIIRGVEGELYPCALDIFRDSYRTDHEVSADGA